MKKIVAILILIYTGNVSAQVNIKQKDTVNQEMIRLDIGAFLTSKSSYSKGTYNSNVNNLYHIGVGFSKNFNNYNLSLGPRLDYYNQILINDRSAMILSVFIQNQLNIRPQEKTFFIYANGGIAPKLGGNFYAANIFELGFGGQNRPKFLNKKVQVSLGYNITNLKKVYAEFHSSSDGINFVTSGNYQRLNLSSLAINIGITL